MDLEGLLGRIKALKKNHGWKDFVPPSSKKAKSFEAELSMYFKAMNYSKSAMHSSRKKRTTRRLAETFFRANAPILSGVLDTLEEREKA